MSRSFAQANNVIKVSVPRARMTSIKCRTEVNYGEGQARMGRQGKYVTGYLLGSRAVGSQILRDPFRKRGETRIMINPVLGIESQRKGTKGKQSTEGQSVKSLLEW